MTEHTLLQQTPRLRIAAWIEQPRIQNAIIGLILINAVLLGLETSPTAMAAAGAPVDGWPYSMWITLRPSAASR